MTATINDTGADVRRAIERTWNRLAKPGGEDPLPPKWLDELAHAVEAQQPGGEMAGQLARQRAQLAEGSEALAAARQRLEHGAEALQEAAVERDELRSENARLADQLEAKQRELEQLGQQHAETLRVSVELDADDQAATVERDQLRLEVDQLRAQLNAGADIDAIRRDEHDRVLAERDQLRDKLATALKNGRPRHQSHQHAYPQPAPDSLPEPCECGKPFPRALFDDPDDDEVAEYQLAGWDELWARVADDLAAAGWAEGDKPDPGFTRRDVDGATYLIPAAEEQTAPPPVGREAKRSTDNALRVSRKGRPLAECGTESGYRRHRKDGEEACQACKTAAAKAVRDRKAAKKAAAEVAG